MAIPSKARNALRSKKRSARSDIPDVGADCGGWGTAVVEIECLNVLATTASSITQSTIANTESRRPRRSVIRCAIGEWNNIRLNE